MKKTAVYALGLLSLAAFLVLELAVGEPPAVQEEMRRAADLMSRAAAAVRDCREAAGLPIDGAVDVNRTGLIGLESSPITTSLGNLEAKRTTANPDFAALVVLLLHQAGVRRGDAVAVGASGSFPALTVAVLCAAETLGARPLVIGSLGASEWGANDPRFDWLSLTRCLRRSGLVVLRDSRALGRRRRGRRQGYERPGPGDRLSPRPAPAACLFSRNPTSKKTSAGGWPFTTGRRGRPEFGPLSISAARYANLGTDSEILEVSPGLASFSHLPPAERRGVVFAMAARGVPVIHLLYIKGLCDRYRLPWDPRPLPAPGGSPLYGLKGVSPGIFLAVAGVYFALTVACFYQGDAGKSPRARRGP